MNICIQNYTMKKDMDNTVLSVRLTGAEAARFWHVMDDAKNRNAYVGKSDVVRELLGLNPPNALSAKEIHFFRTGEKQPGLLAGTIKLGKPAQKRKVG